MRNSYPLLVNDDASRLVTNTVNALRITHYELRIRITHHASRFHPPTPQQVSMQTIAIIEDDQQIRRVLEGYLQQAGYRVLSAADGTTGYRWSSARSRCCSSSI
jgi:PleD family two-component response regulator